MGLKNIFFTSVITIILIFSCRNINCKIFERCELARMFKNNFGLPVEEIAIWVCIAQHQSGLNSSSYTGTIEHGSHGIFQISDEFWCSPPGKGLLCDITCDQLRDDDLSDDYACIKQIHDEHQRITGDGFAAWSMYPQYCKRNAQKSITGCFDNYETEMNLIDVVSNNNDFFLQQKKIQKPVKIYDRCELARELYYKHKIQMEEIADWICIAKHESNFNTSAIGRMNIDGSNDHGIFQISDLYWCSPPGGSGACRLPCHKLEDDDITDDVECSKIIFDEHSRISGNGFTAWTAYTSYCENRTTNYAKDCFSSEETAESVVNTLRSVLTKDVTKPRGKIYKPCELAEELRSKHNIPDDEIATWVCIAKYESNYNTSAIGYGDHGLFQISDIYWCSPPGRGWACGLPCSDFEDNDITDDVICMKKIFKEHQKLTGNGFNAWTVYPLYCSDNRSEQYIENCTLQNEIIPLKIPTVTASDHRPFVDQQDQRLLHLKNSFLETFQKNSADDTQLEKPSKLFNNELLKKSYPSQISSSDIFIDNSYRPGELSQVVVTTTKQPKILNRVFIDKVFQSPISSYTDTSTTRNKLIDSNIFLKNVFQPVSQNKKQATKRPQLLAGNQFLNIFDQSKNPQQSPTKGPQLPPGNIFLDKYYQSGKSQQTTQSSKLPVGNIFLDNVFRNAKPSSFGMQGTQIPQLPVGNIFLDKYYQSGKQQQSTTKSPQLPVGNIFLDKYYQSGKLQQITTESPQLPVGNIFLDKYYQSRKPQQSTTKGPQLPVGNIFLDKYYQSGKPQQSTTKGPQLPVGNIFLDKYYQSGKLQQRTTKIPQFPVGNIFLDKYYQSGKPQQSTTKSPQVPVGNIFLDKYYQSGKPQQITTKSPQLPVGNIFLDNYYQSGKPQQKTTKNQTLSIVLKEKSTKSPSLSNSNIYFALPKSSQIKTNRTSLNNYSKTYYQTTKPAGFENLTRIPNLTYRNQVLNNLTQKTTIQPIISFQYEKPYAPRKSVIRTTTAARTTKPKTTTAYKLTTTKPTPNSLITHTTPRTTSKYLERYRTTSSRRQFTSKISTNTAKTIVAQTTLSPKRNTLRPTIKPNTLRQTKPTSTFKTTTIRPIQIRGGTTTLKPLTTRTISFNSYKSQKHTTLKPTTKRPYYQTIDNSKTQQKYSFQTSSTIRPSYLSQANSPQKTLFKKTDDDMETTTKFDIFQFYFKLYNVSTKQTYDTTKSPSFQRT